MTAPQTAPPPDAQALRQPGSSVPKTASMSARLEMVMSCLSGSFSTCETVLLHRKSEVLVMLLCPSRGWTMVKFVPRQTSALRGEASTRLSEAKKHGRRLPKVCSSFRSLSRPCSGRTVPVPHSCWRFGCE